MNTFSMNLSDRGSLEVHAIISQSAASTAAQSRSAFARMACSKNVNSFNYRHMKT